VTVNAAAPSSLSVGAAIPIAVAAVFSATVNEAAVAAGAVVSIRGPWKLVKPTKAPLRSALLPLVS
jgi:hypothetical protein